MPQEANFSFVDPKSVLNQITVPEGATVADFGCGSGFFSFAFAERIGEEGKVYALDVLPSALEAVASNAKLKKLTNVVPKRVNLERENGSGLGPASVDWVVLKDMLFQNEKKGIIITEMARIMKPGGRAIVMEWNPQASAVGPDKKLRIQKDDLRKLLESAGLSVEGELMAGGYHYALLVTR
jgi:ubiquinone/menaquinone biosynthesis C-methylase UbiE